MKKNSTIEYLAPQIVPQEFKVEEGIAASSPQGAGVSDIQENNTYETVGEWS